MASPWSHLPEILQQKIKIDNEINILAKIVEKPMQSTFDWNAFADTWKDKRSRQKEVAGLCHNYGRKKR